MSRFRSRRRTARGRARRWITPLAAAAAVTAAVVVALPHAGALSLRTDADSATPLEASYQAGTNWGTGYSGQYNFDIEGAAVDDTAANALRDQALAAARTDPPNREESPR
jgi:hypothetical protein